MSTAVAVQEDEILQLLRDYLEESGRVECLAAFERETKTVPIGLPSELTWLRELVFKGAWEEVLQFLKTLNKTEAKEGYRKCLFEALKQQYLETINEISIKTTSAGQNKTQKERMEVFKHQLQELEQVCPSSESYKSLCSLMTLPSLSVSQEYSNWNKYTARIECFYILGKWVSSFLYPDMEFKKPPSKPHVRYNVSNRLTQLLSKGLLFEECESMCAQRCGESEIQQGTEILDLCSWILHQPDSAFQDAPLKRKLVVAPQLDSAKKTPLQQSQFSKSMTIANENKFSLQQQLTSQSVPVFQVVMEQGDEAEGENDGNTSPLLWHKAPKTPVRQEAENEKVSSNGRTDPVVNEQNPSQPIEEHNTIVANKESNEDKPNEQESTDGTEFKYNFSSDFTPNVKLPHKPRLGRDSSTPKPSGLRPTLPNIQPSPMASPVPHINTTPQRSAMQGGSEKQPVRHPGSSAKKAINFSNQDQSVVLPSAMLLSRVTDSQVVRSVAFSNSGEVVAIGANSKTLRLCLTASLFQGTPDEELPVYYNHPRYHKGSIYCMAWMRNNLLASGSNDQTIRFLSYNSELPTPWKSQGQMNIHNGTVRDLLFTSTDQLVSGGAGDPVIKLSDCSARQVVNIFSGHTDQILALANVQHNVIASGSQDKTIKLWDLRQKTSYSTIELSDSVLSLTASDNRLACSHLDGSCSIYDLFSLKLLASYNAHSDECRTVRFSPNGGHWLLSGSYDGSVCVCDTGSLEWQQVGQHNDKVVQCRWHCNGEVFATTGADKKACFWMLSEQ